MVLPSSMLESIYKNEKALQSGVPYTVIGRHVFLQCMVRHFWETLMKCLPQMWKEHKIKIEQKVEARYSFFPPKWERPFNTCTNQRYIYPPVTVLCEMLATTKQQKESDKAFVKVRSSIFVTFSFLSFVSLVLLVVWLQPLLKFLNRVTSVLLHKRQLLDKN